MRFKFIPKRVGDGANTVLWHSNMSVRASIVHPATGNAHGFDMWFDRSTDTLVFAGPPWMFAVIKRLVLSEEKMTQLHEYAFMLQDYINDLWMSNEWPGMVASDKTLDRYRRKFFAQINAALPW